MPGFRGFSRPIGLWLACTGVLIAVLFPPNTTAQGFGTSKKKVVLRRKLPPTAHLSGTTFKVDATSHGVQSDIAIDLRNMLETELLKNDARLRTDDKRPDILITCVVTDYSQPQPQSHTETTSIPGSKKQTTETLTRYDGSMTISYQAKDARTGRTLDSDNIHAKYDEEFNQYGSTSKGIAGTFTSQFNKLKHGRSTEDTPPAAADVKNRLLTEAVHQIASRLVNTDEPVEVLLARGKFDDANKQAEAGLWPRYLETLETMTPLPNKEDDAYRVYNIGVAYEALAYQAEDPKTAQKNLQETAINYGKAIDDKPSEKYFLQPQTRIQTAMTHYRKLRDQSTQVDAESKKPAPHPNDSSKDAEPIGGRMSTASTGDPTSSRTTTTKAGTTAAHHTSTLKSSVATHSATAAKSTGPALTNDQVIQMVKASIDEENIIDTIRTASAVNFDLSVDGQVKLANNGVKGKILTAMKHRARQTAAHNTGTH